MKVLKKYPWVFIFLFFAVGVSIHWFSTGLAKATGESGLMFLTLKKHLELSSFTWVDSTIGETSFSRIGAFPFLVILNFTGKFLSEGYNQALFFGFCIFIGVLGVSLFIKYLYPKINSRYLLFAGVAYVFNPYSIPFIWNRFLYDLIYAYCVIPFLLYLWLWYLKDGRKKVLLLFFISSFLASLAFSGIAFILSFLIGALIISLLSIVKNRSKASLYRLIVLFITFSFSQIFWVLPFYFSDRLGVGLSTSFFSEAGNLNTTVALSERYGGILEKLRMARADMPQLAYDNVPWAQWFTQTPIYYMSFVPVIGVIYSAVYIFRTKMRYRYFVIIAFLFTLILVNGTSFPLGELYLQMYKLNANLQILRNPYEKLGMLFILFLVVVWSAGMWQLYAKGKKRLSTLFLAISVVWWLSSFQLVVDGRVFTYSNPISNDPHEGFSTKVPVYYQDANQFLSNSDPNSRLLAVPITGEGVTQNWEYGYDGVESYNAIFNKPVISLNTTSGQLPEIAGLITSLPVSDLLVQSRKLNVSDILVRNDLELPIYAVKPDTYNSVLSESLNGKTIEKNKLTIYPVPEEFQSPKIFASYNYNYSNNPLYNPNLSQIDVYNHLPTSDTPNIIYPDNVTEEYKIDPLVHPDNLEGFLPHIRYNHDSMLYPFVRLKEGLWKMVKPQEARPILVTLAYKRLAEIGDLVKRNQKKGLVDAVESYNNAIKPLLEEAKVNIASGNDQSFWWLNFQVHDMALGKYESIASKDNIEIIKKLHEELINKLKSVGIYPLYEYKLGVTSDDFIERIKVNVPASGMQEIRIEHRGLNITYDFDVQVDNNIYKLIDLGFKKNDSYDSFYMNLEKGAHQIWVPIIRSKQDLLTDEIKLSTIQSDSKDSSLNLTVPLPTYNGKIAISFEYRILKDHGPNVVIYQKDKTYRPQLIRDFPSDPYYFDWAYKSIELPFIYDSKSLDISFSAITGNDCEQKNPLDLKCKNNPFRELYDKHTTFLLRNIVATTTPDVNFVLISGKLNEQNVPDSPKVYWDKINPSMYRVNVTHVNDKYLLSFLDQYHPGWKLYKVGESVIDGKNINWKKYSSEEFISSNNFIVGIIDSIKAIFGQRVNDADHVEVFGYANGWILDQSGSYILVFQPQIMLYLGWFITVVSGIIVVLYAYKTRTK